ELPGVGGQALHVPALALGVERVEGEAALARAGHARDHHQAAGGDGELDVLEVVDADAAGEDGFGHGSGRAHAASATKTQPPMIPRDMLAPSAPRGVISTHTLRTTWRAGH